MSERVQQQVLGYLLGALDDSEMESVAQRLRSDREYRRAWQETRRRLGHLRDVEASEPDVDVPPRLTQRTVDLVIERARKSGPLALRRGLSPATASRDGSHGGYRITWIDMAIVAAMAMIAGMVLSPALFTMRNQARVVGCQNNLHDVGMALVAYSQANNDCFPEVPYQGKLATAGIYAPLLSRCGLLPDASTLLCPDSALAQSRDFHIVSVDELMRAGGAQEMELKSHLGGSYGYCLDHFENGRLAPTHNRSRDYFAIMSDAPSVDRPDRQSNNHGGLGQNVLFEDLHVKFLTTAHDDFSTDNIFENDNHLVAPGVQCDDAVIVGSGTQVMYASLQ